MAVTPARMHQRRRTAAQWASENPILAAGEIGIATGLPFPLLKVGDGATAWNSLKNVLVNTAEDTAFSVAEMYSTAAVNTGSSFPRYTLPDGVTTSVFIGGFNCPNWYRKIDVHYGHVNDHTATGNVRVRTILREVDVGEAVSAGTVIHDVTATIPSAAANGGMTVSIAAASVTLNPGGFGQVYGFEFQRIGGDAADTLLGPFGLVAVGFARIDT